MLYSDAWQELEEMGEVVVVEAEWEVEMVAVDMKDVKIEEMQEEEEEEELEEKAGQKH